MSETWAETIRRLAANCSEPEWDGYSAKAVTDKAVEAACLLAEKLPNHGIKQGKTVMSPLGGVQFEWSGDQGDIELEILADGTCEALLDEYDIRDESYNSYTDVYNLNHDEAVEWMRDAWLRIGEFISPFTMEKKSNA